jgi:hypothetical protein
MKHADIALHNKMKCTHCMYVFLHNMSALPRLKKNGGRYVKESINLVFNCNSDSSLYVFTEVERQV